MILYCIVEVYRVVNVEIQNQGHVHNEQGVIVNASQLVAADRKQKKQADYGCWGKNRVSYLV